MASSALNVISGIAAAAAGLAGDKVSKDGSVPGLDLATILPALMGAKSGGSGIVGTLASVAAKSGLLTGANLGKLAELAGSLISSKTGTAKTTGTEKKTAASGIAGLAAAIAGNTGTGSGLGSIATMAAKLAKTATTTKELTGMASELGKTLSSSFGLNFTGSATAVKALDKVTEGDTKTDLFKAILKGLS
jgi:hypothetical protein